MGGNGERPVGKTQNAGWQVGARRTFDVTTDEAWSLLTSERGLELWLGRGLEGELLDGDRYRLEDGTQGEVRVFKPGSHVRLTWRPPDWERSSTIQVRVIPKGDRCVVAFHQEHMPNQAARESRRQYFSKVLSELREAFESQ